MDILIRAALAIRREDAPPLSAAAMLAAGDLLEGLARFSDDCPVQVKLAAIDFALACLGEDSSVPATGEASQ